MTNHVDPAMSTDDRVRKAARLLYGGYQEALSGDSEELVMLATDALEVLAGKYLPEDYDKACVMTFEEWFGDV